MRRAPNSCCLVPRKMKGDVMTDGIYFCEEVVEEEEVESFTLGKSGKEPIIEISSNCQGDLAGPFNIKRSKQLGLCIFDVDFERDSKVICSSPPLLSTLHLAC